MLNLFIDWVKNGVYNFHYLPLNMKVRLSKQIVDNIDNLPKKYEGQYIQILEYVLWACVNKTVCRFGAKTATGSNIIGGNITST